MSDMTTMAVRALATYRLTRLMTRDTIFSPVRDAVWEKYPPETSSVGYVLTCDWCSSVWAASTLEISRMIAPKTTRTVESILALSAVAGLLTAHEDRM